MPIFLAGYRGTGKSTLGRLLAERLGWQFIDVDDQVEEQAGRSIADIFATDGEESFRDLEEEVVAKLCETDQVIIGLGGGSILREASRNRVKEAGPVIYLTASAEELALRIDHDATSESRRPSLTQNEDLLAEVKEVLKHRKPLYEECATITVSTQDWSPDALADEVLKQLRDARHL